MPVMLFYHNNYVAGLIFIKTKIPRFYLEQGSSTLNNLMGRVKTINYRNHVCSKQDPLIHFKRLPTGIFGFSQNETGAKSTVLPWQKHSRCHSDSFVVYVSDSLLYRHF